MSKANVTSDSEKFRDPAFDVLITPLPVEFAQGEDPVAWIDLHVSDAYYERCGSSRHLKFKKDRGGRSYAVLPPGRSFRFRTLEEIAIKADVAAIFTNVAGKAVAGASVVGGRVEPGFRREPLALVVTNLSRRSIVLHGASATEPPTAIATIGFLKLPQKVRPREKPGWGNREYEPLYRPQIIERMRDEISNLDKRALIGFVLKTSGVVVLTLLVQYAWRTFLV